MQAPVYGFGEWQLDSGQRLLFRSGTLVPLPPKVLETLLVLVEHRGRIVEKEELLSRLWPDTIVEEGNVLRNVSTLRKALKEGDGRDGSELIETIPRRGYRFLAPVTLIENGEQLSVAPPSTPHSAGRLPASGRIGQSIGVKPGERQLLRLLREQAGGSPLQLPREHSARARGKSLERGDSVTRAAETGGFSMRAAGASGVAMPVERLAARCDA